MFQALPLRCFIHVYVPDDRYKAVHLLKFFVCYGKYPKISNTKLSYNLTYAKNADPYQTAPEYTVCLLCNKYCKKQVHIKRKCRPN